MRKITFRFSFDTKHHADVISILESVPKNMRTGFIVEVIRYSMSNIMQIPLEKLIKKESLKELLNDFSIEKEEKTKISSEEKLKHSSDKLSLSISQIFGKMNQF